MFLPTTRTLLVLCLFLGRQTFYLVSRQHHLSLLLVQGYQHHHHQRQPHRRHLGLGRLRLGSTTTRTAGIRRPVNPPCPRIFVRSGAHTSSSSSSSSSKLSPRNGVTSRATTTTTTSTTQLSMMPIDVTVAKASIAATAKLLSSIGLGGLAALQPGVLDANAIRSLSRLTYWVFQPAFLFCSVSKTLHNAAAAAAATTTTTATTGLSLAALWLLPCLAVTQIAAGAILGRIVAATFQIADHEVPNVRMCTTFANSGPLPLIFTDALFGKNPLLQSQMAAGISFYLLAWSPLFWTVGKIILGTSETKHSTTTTATAKQDNNNNKPLFWSKIVATTQQILSPPVLGSIAGLLVGVVAPLRNLFFQKGLLEPLYGALHTLGTAYLPAALLVLAGSLVGKRSSKSTVTTSSDEDDNNNNKVLDDETNNNNNNNDKPTARGIAAIATYRFLISPALTWIMASFLQGLSWMDGRTKAIITFLCLMEGCMPPAQNSVIMLQLVGLSGPAAAMAKLLTLLYAGAVIPVTLLLTACLQKSGIMAYL